MSIPEVFDQVSGGGATDFVMVVRCCEAAGSYCLIGGLALNTYVEPVYTMDADFVLTSGLLARIVPELQASGFRVEEHPHSTNATMPGSQLRIQFPRDPRYARFPERAVSRDLFRVRVKIAALENLLQGKIWAWQDPQRRLSKREKDRLDLVRIGENFPELRDRLPSEIRALFG